MSLDFSALLVRLGEIFLYLCIGVLCRRTGLLDDTGNRVLSRVIMYIAFPGVLLNSIIGLDIALTAGQVFSVLGLAILWQGSCVLLGLLLSRLFSRDPQRRGVYAFALSFGNVGAFALPVLQPLFGAVGMAFTALMNVPFSLFAFTAGVRVISGRRLTARESVQGMVFPQMLASLLVPVLAILRPTMPEILSGAVRGVNALALPLLMITVGSSLAAGGLRLWANPRVYAAAALKLLLIPLALLPLLRLSLSDDILRNVVLLLTGMPTAGFCSPMAILYGNKFESEAGAVTVATTLLSLLTIPLLTRLLL